jgi:hypothetical protein
MAELDATFCNVCGRCMVQTLHESSEPANEPLSKLSPPTIYAEC